MRNACKFNQKMVKIGIENVRGSSLRGGGGYAQVYNIYTNRTKEVKTSFAQQFG
jgi:hypothetical protein